MRSSFLCSWPTFGVREGTRLCVPCMVGQASGAAGWAWTMRDLEHGSRPSRKLVQPLLPVAASKELARHRGSDEGEDEV